ncbi:unnamed protein product, partial [marine sediment metagenome]
KGDKEKTILFDITAVKGKKELEKGQKVKYKTLPRERIALYVKLI